MFVEYSNFNVFLVLGVGACICVSGLLVSSSRFLSCLILLENLNILLLISCLLLSLLGGSGVYSVFVALMVMFTIEVVLCLIIMVRIWSFGAVLGILSF